LPYLDHAYDFLTEWTQFIPYSGEKIGLQYDQSFFKTKPEKIIGWSGNPIYIKLYPAGILEQDLRIYFHELTHDFTPSNLWKAWDVTKSLTEGIADLGVVFLYSSFSGSLRNQSEIMEDAFLEILERYEAGGSPFEVVKWVEDHPDDEYPSDNLAAGMLVAISRRYGWQTYTRLFTQTWNGGVEAIFGDLTSFSAKMNFFVYLLSSSANADLTSLFRFWGFPLTVDSDEDGSTDGEEIAHGLPTLDFDQDGLNDKEEIILKTNPNGHDTDKDGLRDGQEIDVGADPLKQDSDGDGVNDYEETVVFQTSPTTEDTDSDLWNDYLETSIVRWINEHIPSLSLMAKQVPLNWWLPNTILVSVLLGLLILILLVKRR
jgi:hypothetical protein